MIRAWCRFAVPLGIFLVFSVCAFGSTLGGCSLNASTNTLTITEGPESSSDHGGVDCNLKDVGLLKVGKHPELFQLVESTAQKFPCSDRVNITHNHVTLISDPRAPDHGLPCTPNRINVNEVALGGGRGFGADLGTGLIATSSGAPVDLVVISDQVPEPGSLVLLGTGLVALALAAMLRRFLRIC